MKNTTFLFLSFCICTCFLGCNTEKGEANNSNSTDFSTFSSKELAENKVTTPIELHYDVPEMEKKMVTASCLDSVTTQTAIVDLKEETMIIGQEGTYFSMSPGCFLDDRGNVVNENIKVEIKEINFDDDLLRSGVTTMCKNQPLASGGTFFFEASANGKKLTINPDVGVSFGIPTAQKDAEMELFKGEETEDGDITWIYLKKEDEPLPEKPTEKEDTQTLHDLQWMREMLIAIENGEYRLKGDYYVPTKNVSISGNRFRFTKEYIENGKKWLKETEKREAAIVKKNALIRQAYQRYETAYKEKYAKEIKDIKQLSAYEFKINTMGWYNCDKFLKGDLVEYKGRVVDEKGEAATWVRIHLIAKDQRIHLKKIIKEKGEDFSFKLPKNTPFEIVVARGSRIKRKYFDGKNTHLKEILFAVQEE